MEFQIKNKTETQLKDCEFLDFNGNLVKDKNKTIYDGRFNHIVSENDNKRVGKIERYSNGNSVYFIKAIKFGSPGEMLINPHNQNVLTAYNETDTRSRTFYYMVVNEDIFNTYVRFLHTRNDVYLLNISRRIKDGEL